MSKTKKSTWATSTIQLALIGAPVAASMTAQAQTFAPQNHTSDLKQQHGAHLASLKSIESSWLEVPVSCKAKGFNADPKKRSIRPTLSQIAKNAYQSYGV